MIKTPNLKLKLAHFLQNLFTVCQTVCTKNASHPVYPKKPREYVDEIDRRSKIISLKTVLYVDRKVLECLGRH